MAQAKAQSSKAGAHKPVGTDISTARRVSRLRRHNRLRKRVSGTPERPRLVVNRSSRHIHVQLVDDTAGRTLASASTMDAEPAWRRGRQVRPGPPGRRPDRRPGEGSGVTAVVLDRGGNRYAGRIAALADAAREGGLDF